MNYDGLFTAASAGASMMLTLIALARGRTIKKMNAVMQELHTCLKTAEDRATLAQAGGLDELPLPLADASIAIFVIDRVPEVGVDFQISANMPVIWMNPRLQRSWRWAEDVQEWIENTIIGANDINHLVAFTRDDVFVHMNTVWQLGAHARVLAVNAAHFDTDAGQETVQSNIAAMHPAICAGMDAQAGTDGVWTQIRDLHLRGLPVALERNDRVQRVAPEPASDLRNPFEQRRRPIITDE